MIKKLFWLAATGSILVSVGAFASASTITSTEELVCSVTSPSNVKRTDVSKLTPFDQTRGEPNKARHKINSRQHASFNFTRVDHQTLRVRVTDVNRYREKGDTFRNTAVFYDKCGVPLAVFYNERGVKPRIFTSGAKSTKTDSRFVQPSADLDRIAYFRVHADNRGDTHGFGKELGDVVVRGVYKGIENMIAKKIEKLGS